MIRRLLLVLPAVSVIFVSGSAFAQNAGDCGNMLTASVGRSLDGEGYDTSNVCDLSVGDLAVIKSLLTEEGMGTRRRIQLILDRAG